MKTGNMQGYVSVSKHDKTRMAWNKMTLSVKCQWAMHSQVMHGQEEFNIKG